MNRTAYQPTLPFPDQPFRPFDFVGSHDRNPRLASELEDRKAKGMPHEVGDAERLAAYVLLLFGDRPILYAGDELLQRGWKWNGNRRTAANSPGDGSGIYDETLREPFPWYRSGAGEGQTTWFAPRFDKPDDGVSLEEENRPGTVFDTLRGITNLRTRYPGLADGDLGEIPTDSGDWMVFEKVQGAERFLVLINTTSLAMTYQLHEGWLPRFIAARLIFQSDGAAKTWQVGDTPMDRSVAVPPFGMVVIRQPG